MSPRHDPLASNPIFAGLSTERRREIVARGRRQRYGPRERVLSEGDAADRVFCLLSGSVRVFHAAPAGGEVLLKIFKAPAVFGEMEVISGLPFLENVAALEPTELLIVDREPFLALLRAEISVANGLLHDLSARFCIATHNEKLLAFEDVRTRLASFLSSYVAFDGKRVRKGQTFRLAVSQADMAASVGVTRRAVAKELARWQKEGVVVYRDNAYVITDLTRLRREARPLHLALTYSLGMPLLSSE